MAFLFIGGVSDSARELLFVTVVKDENDSKRSTNVREQENIPQQEGEGRQQKTILLFSPDLDLCVSLRLLLQSQYHVVTTTDPDMLIALSCAYHPELIIVDSPPTRPMRQRFETIRKECPHTQFMMFYVSMFDDDRVRETVRETVDAAFSKPFDLQEVTQSIDHLLMGYAN